VHQALQPLGAALLGSRLLPRAFGYSAVAAGEVSIILGLAALFSAAAFSLAISLITAESAWVLAAAGALVISPGQDQRPPAPAIARPSTAGAAAVPRGGTQQPEGALHRPGHPAA
jgi:hypothetical protein